MAAELLPPKVCGTDLSNPVQKVKYSPVLNLSDDRYRHLIGTLTSSSSFLP